MDSYRRIAALKIQSAQDRAHAIVEEIGRVENKVYASPGSKQLLRFVEDAAIRLQGLLEDERSIAKSDLLSASELETRLDRTPKLIPYLHILLGFVDVQGYRYGAAAHCPPAEIDSTGPATLQYHRRRT